MCGNIGFVTSTTGAVAGVTDLQNKVLNQIANRTRNLKNEQYRIINENGEIVLEKRGGRGEVGSTVGEKRENMPGAVSIHNHPDGGTFSADDLRDFGYGARQIVAAAPEGDYKLTRKGKNSSWLDMQRAMEKAGLLDEKDALHYKKEAEKLPKFTKKAQQVSNLSKQWLDARQAGKSKEHLDSIANKINTIRADYKKALDIEVRNLETKPYHDFFKKNANKYGFEYAFTKKR